MQSVLQIVILLQIGTILYMASSLVYQQYLQGTPLISCRWLPSNCMVYKYENRQPYLTWREERRIDRPGIRINSCFGEYHILCQRLGYKIRAGNESFECNEKSRADNMRCQRFRQLTPYVISNHEEAQVTFTDYIHGVIEYVTHKANLVSRGGKHIPKGFDIPKQTKDFMHYALNPENTNKKWIQKNTRHRGNQFKDIEDINLYQKSIVQEFIANPFLIDGRKFSIGVLVAFSSAKPLRAYVQNTSIALRFCGKPYNADNLSDPTSYVTDGMEFDVKLIREIDSLRDYSSTYQYSTTQSLNAYLKSVGVDPSAIHRQITDAIQDVLTTRYDLITMNADSRSKTFMLTRWDFIVDTDINVHLIEANINPALCCQDFTSAQLDKYACINGVYNVFRAMGIASYYDYDKTSIQYIIRSSDIHISDEICYTSSCKSCELQRCRLCSHCLSETQRGVLESVFWEHLRQGEMRLVYPFVTNEAIENNIFVSNSSKVRNDDDTLTKQWLQLKCRTDVQWCDAHH